MHVAPAGLNAQQTSRADCGLRPSVTIPRAGWGVCSRWIKNVKLPVARPTSNDANPKVMELDASSSLHVPAVQNVLPPLVGFHDGSPDGDGESEKQNRFDDHVFNPCRPSIEDRPATVVNKVGASTRSDIINGRCDIFAAPAHSLEQIERRGNDRRPFRSVIREMRDIERCRCCWPVLVREPARLPLQVIFSFEPSSDLLDHFAPRCRLAL
jgi:hypothetical protein